MNEQPKPDMISPASASSKDDALVLFMPSGKRGRFAVGTPVLDAARDLGVYVESVCGGRGICGKCQVSVAEGQFAKHGITSSAENLSQFSDTEARYKSKRELADDRRLSCSSKINGDLVIDIPQAASANNQMVRKAADTRDIPRDLATHLRYVEVEEPDMHKPLGDADRLVRQLKADWGYDNLSLDFHLYKTLQTTLRKGDWAVTAAVHTVGDKHTVTALWSGYREKLFGLACDIGSTTIAMHLSDMMSGETVASAGVANPQIRFGEDLMSRVSYVMMNKGGEVALTKSVREAIDGLIADICEQSGVAREDILEATFVGNPIMHHLFLGLDPTEIGQAPFALTVSDALTLPARDLEINLNEGARVYTLPCIAGHVGADAAAATLAERPYEEDEITLLVDVGTNAEIVLGSKDRTVAASSPTGPAFEGAEISCGQRAAPGAIERIRINPETLEPRVRIIGSEKWSDEDGFADEAKETGVTGVCGSGIIEVVAEMFLAGVITEDGIIDGSKAALSNRVIEDGRTFSYVAWRGENGSPDLIIKQTDIRAIQLAKAALYAGVRLLMDKLGVTQVAKIKFAGAFGNFIDPKYAMVLGLIPDCDLEHVRAVGNAAGTGARMALLNKSYREEIEQMVGKIEKIETALEPAFQELFVNAMALPNKVDAFPNLAKEVTLPEKSEPTDGDGGGGRRRRGGRARRG
ncbi:MAG: ASKHA domain-containing protein [Hyphomicrobiales bacterium]